MRIAEPHDYGENNGVPQLLVYQVGGQSRSGKLPNWRRVDLTRVSDFELLDRTFAGSRGDASQQHHTWDRVFLRVGDGQ